MNSDRRHIHNHLRILAMPVVRSPTEQQEMDTLISQSLTFWLDNQEESSLKEEANKWLPKLFTHGWTFHDQTRTVEKWVKILHTETERVIDTLNQWKDSSDFCFMEDCVKANARTASQSLLTSLARTGANIQCYQCSRSFRTLADYNKHYKNHQQGRLRVCDVCEGEYTNMTQHLRTHTGEKPYKCKHPGCSKAFAQSRDLAHHIYIHSAEKPFKCDYCGKRFNQQANLTTHLRTHTGEKPYKCEHPGCGKAFSQRSGLTKHIRTHSGEKPYKCEHPGCGKAFTQRNHLINHIRTHTGEKPYMCEYPDCGRTFAQRDYFTKHIRTHSGEKPYKCKFCNNAFAASSARNRHQKICKKNKQP